MEKTTRPSWKIGLLLSILSVVFALLFLEVSVRAYDKFTGFGFLSSYRNPFLRPMKTVLPFRTFGFEMYKDKDGVKHISSRHGEMYPLEKPDGTFRIVVFGGSTSENNHSFKEAETHYPLVLQSKLREALGTEAIEVISVANSGYATPHSLILFELDVLHWEPDMIIVSHNINDLFSSYWPNFTFDYSNKYSNPYYSMPDYQSLYTASNVLFQKSQLYWLIRNRYKQLTHQNAAIQRRSYGMEPLPLAVEVFKRNFRSFAAIAKENGVKVLLGNQPLQPTKKFFMEHMDHKPYNSLIFYPFHEEFVRHHQAFNETIEQSAKELGVLFVDNDSKLQGKEEYFIDFVHYTPEGVNVLADSYADFLIEKNVIQLSQATKLSQAN